MGYDDDDTIVTESLEEGSCLLSQDNLTYLSDSELS